MGRFPLHAYQRWVRFNETREQAESAVLSQQLQLREQAVAAAESAVVSAFDGLRGRLRASRDGASLPEWEVAQAWCEQCVEQAAAADKARTAAAERYRLQLAELRGWRRRGEVLERREAAWKDGVSRTLELKAQAELDDRSGRRNP